ncbi:DUF924 family protein [Maritimibacter sp. UBA3975]|uniref:DUF924 family protein n=1 Tax=Maritimibacter sp. UBA3975 TaxID=1946833 RepID=UPI000C090EFE|nr:DUF924 family protein [Maritimibacter sp. UBA3975]MAM61791.1 hypothetical protein [Maritimibacter sp.]|tara:strand:- start:7831 stop:8454 length:624 start_codon:yes stop_codon:yes gene_type:complete
MNAGDVLSFCFPEGLDADLDRHLAYWGWMMRGGADEGIVTRFAGLVPLAASGELDDWADTPRGRLALILVLDQFPRSLYRDDPRAYATDAQALALTEEGLANGDFTALVHSWERTMFALPLVHAEGPDHAARAALGERLAADTLEMAPEPLKPAYEFCLAQSRRHRAVIARFGRHPHRNAVLGRETTADEAAYIADGAFPHQHEIDV